MGLSLSSTLPLKELNQATATVSDHSPQIFLNTTLCETYEFLCVDVLGGCSITQTISALKSRKIEQHTNYKSKARDAAFKLLYLISLEEFKNDKKDSDKISNAVLFLVSDSKFFGARTRSVIRAAYEERFIVSTKQKIALDVWEKTDNAKIFESDEGNATTEDEGPGYYDSESWKWPPVWLDR